MLVALLVPGVLLAWEARGAPVKLLTHVLLLAGLFIALGVELFYIRDFLDGSAYERMNTVFKFYYEVWLLLSLGSALALYYLLPRMLAGFDALIAGKSRARVQDGMVPALAAPSGDLALPNSVPLAGVDAPTRYVSHERAAQAPTEALEASLQQPAQPDNAASQAGARALRQWQRALVLPGALRAAWMVVLLFLVVGSSIFLVLGTPARVEEHLGWAAYQPPPGGIQPALPSLDGMGYMRGWYPGDYAAIMWMNEHIGGIPTIVEAAGSPSSDDYLWYGRVSIYTGLPAVVGWVGHEFGAALRSGGVRTAE